MFDYYIMQFKRTHLCSGITLLGMSEKDSWVLENDSQYAEEVVYLCLKCSTSGTITISWKQRIVQLKEMDL